MGIRKTIGLFVEGDDTWQEGVMVDAIIDAVCEKDYNVLIFHSLMKKPAYDDGVLSDNVVSGESAIYKLPDYRLLDGVIILGEILRPDVTQDIVRRAQAQKLPVININDTHQGCYNVNYDDVVGMKEMVLHLIRDHGCRKIDFISGFQGNKESREREEAYRSALEESGIPFEMDRIGYGEFYLPAVKVAEEFMQRQEKPDAFVCANDTMAMFITKYLTDLGYRVPEDIIVTGFDHTSEAAEFQPSIASVERSIYESGKVAVELLEKLWRGECVPENTKVPAHLVLNQSCGCKERTKLDLNRINQAKINEITERDLFIHQISGMWRDFVSADSMEALFRLICQYMDFFEWDELKFCICEDVFGQRSVNAERIQGYTPHMVMVTYRKGKEPEFKTVYYPDILPELDLQGEERQQQEFIPMYMNQHTIGYMWLPAEHSIRKAPMLYAFMTTVNSAITEFCLLKEKDILVNKLDSMYVRDELTKLYNRFGMERYVDKILDVAKKKGEMVMCVAMDLDGLKVINDTYGHADGDNAIVQVANAMRQASERREVCIRSGGDEFLVFGIVDQEAEAAAYVQRVEEYLDHYNAMNNWPYTVACSCGYCVHTAEQINSLESMIKEADELLYQVKVRKKTLRSQ